MCAAVWLCVYVCMFVSACLRVYVFKYVFGLFVSICVQIKVRFGNLVTRNFRAFSLKTNFKVRSHCKKIFSSFKNDIKKNFKFFFCHLRFFLFIRVLLLVLCDGTCGSSYKKVCFDVYTHEIN